MSTTFSIPEETQLLTEAEPIEDFDLTDAEQEELAELWAADSGNQGA